MDNKWDGRFVELASHIAKWSKDPSTKCGAVIVRSDKTIASVGYNGFPRGLDDSGKLYDNRSVKYDRVIHAEMNAILNASESLKGHTLYTWPLPTCSRCAVHVIQSGIVRVVFPKLVTKEEIGRWGDSVQNALDYYKEANVEYRLL